MENKILEILMEFYDEKKARRKLKTHIKTSGKSFTLAKLISRYGEKIAIQKFSEKISKDRKKGTLDGYIQRYGEIDGPRKYKEKNSKLSVGINSLKEKGLSDDEIEEIRKTHRDNSSNTLDNMILRHGENGEEYYTDYLKTHKTRSIWNIDHWINTGMSYEEAKETISNLQRRDLDFFLSIGKTEEEYEELCKRRTKGLLLESYIQKYGEEEGRRKKKYDSGKASTLLYYIEKYGEEEGAKVYLDLLKRRTENLSKDSKIQQEFCTLLYEQLSENIQQKFYGMPFTAGYWINFKENEYNIKCCIPDIRFYNIIVEFDGDYWHSSEIIKKRDIAKTILLNDLGFYVIRIAEASYKTDKNAVICNVLQKIEANIDYSFSRSSNNEN